LAKVAGAAAFCAPSFIPCLHDTTDCQGVKPVEQPVGQPVECLFTRCNRLRNRLDNRLYRVNGVLDRRVTVGWLQSSSVAYSLTVRGVLAAAQVGDRNAGSVTLQQEIVGVAGEIRRRVSTGRRHGARETLLRLVWIVVPDAIRTRTSRQIVNCTERR